MLLASGKDGAAHITPGPFVAPEGSLNVEAVLEHLVPDGFSVKERARALAMFGDALEQSAAAAIETSGDGACAVLDALGDRAGTLEPFVGPSDDAEAAHAKARDIARALEPSILALMHHFDPSVRLKAVSALARSSTDMAAAAVARATGDPIEAVQRAAFASLGTHGSADAVDAVTRALEHHESWAIRILAAEALGRFGARGSGEEVSTALRSSATRDDYALVREAALKALASFDAAGGRALAEQLAASDPEPRLRETARAIAQGATN
jgi:hypothetical protein